MESHAELQRVETPEGGNVVTLHFCNVATVDLGPNEQAVHYIGSIVELRLGLRSRSSSGPNRGAGPELTELRVIGRRQLASQA